LIEGTSRAADRDSIREEIREAALDSGGFAKAELCLGEHVEALVFEGSLRRRYLHAYVEA
jgi:hypothetical protein